jgi:hypothetical protein
MTEVSRLRFLHIPKTAGTSFLDCLERLYPGEQFVFSGDLPVDLDNYRKLDPTIRDRITLFAGHAPRVTGEEAIDALPTVTFLRHPISRVMSFCQHVSEGKSPYLVEAFPPEAFDLDAFLASENVELSNLQTRMLLGHGSYELPDTDPDALAARAVRVLRDDITCFGIVEHFDLSLIMFRRTFGWKRVLWRRLNRQGSRRIRFSAEQIKRVEQNNTVDRAVYTWAVKLFQQRLDAVGLRTWIWQALRRAGPRQVTPQ